ncbi:DUF3788 family protein [Candidatus Zixiibacteriota bacterium]
MSISSFDDKTNKPANDTLFKVLGASGKYWRQLKKHLEENYGPITEDWKFYSQQSGWTLKMLRKKRNLFFFTPLKGHFQLTFIFGDRAVAAVEKSELPKDMIDKLKKAKKYMEGRGLQVEIKSREDLEKVKKLVETKVSN